MLRLSGAGSLPLAGNCVTSSPCLDESWTEQGVAKSCRECRDGILSPGVPAAAACRLRGSYVEGVRAFGGTRGARAAKGSLTTSPRRPPNRRRTQRSTPPPAGDVRTRDGAQGGGGRDKVRMLGWGRSQRTACSVCWGFNEPKAR
eukprot:1187739-Prorocentrum_minimum.AAC.1